LLSEVLELYQHRADLHRESLAITAEASKETVAWDWGRLRTRCYREAVRVLPRADAEEAVQEALVRAWLRRDACRSPEAPLPWLLEITRNEARRVLGREARRGSLEPLYPAPREDDALAGAAARLTVEQALGTLAERDRRVLHLRYAEDLTQVEVARRMGLPEATVKVRLHRARGRLRRALEA
jgi:RNA polymerase sigma-70 factor (ECF subfamily)